MQGHHRVFDVICEEPAKLYVLTAVAEQLGHHRCCVCGVTVGGDINVVGHGGRCTRANLGRADAQTQASVGGGPGAEGRR